MPLAMRVMQSVKRIAKQLKPQSRRIAIDWIKREGGSWLPLVLQGDSVKPDRASQSAKIENLARRTDRLGPQPLWDGYASNNTGGPTRRPDEVRTTDAMGDLYTWLVQARKPDIIVEFGTAFGVSGMYFLAGVAANDKGRLLTFEVNEVWAELAEANLSQVSDRFDLTVGTFEENIDRVLPRAETIDMAFIDAIHTKEFVLPQLDLVVARSSPGAIIILDDIGFSDDMRECWRSVSIDDRFAASVALGHRVGVVELART